MCPLCAGKDNLLSSIEDIELYWPSVHTCDLEVLLETLLDKEHAGMKNFIFYISLNNLKTQNGTLDIEAKSCCR